MSFCRCLLSASHLDNSYSGWPWDTMKIYAAQLPLFSCNKNESSILFFSRKRRRAAPHYIKKRVQGKSPNNTTHTHTLTPYQFFLLTCSAMHFVLLIKLVNKELIWGKCHRHCIHYAPFILVNKKCCRLCRICFTKLHFPFVRIHFLLFYPLQACSLSIWLLICSRGFSWPLR